MANIWKTDTYKNSGNGHARAIRFILSALVIVMKKLLSILIIIGILILSVGCAQKSKANNTQEYFSKVDLISYNTDENNKINQEEQFEIQLKEFYDFSQKFFQILNEHIEDITLLLEKFNNKNTNLDDKIICSRMLHEKYEKFSDDLKQINPPDEASKAYQFILNAISKRILFFEGFEKGTSIDTLIEIEKEAYYYEMLFWEEIDKIYDHYLGEINRKNTISI
jgi:hypothetical protein